MTTLKLKIDHAAGFLKDGELDALQETLQMHYKALMNRTGKGNDYLGWIDLPSVMDQQLIRQITEDATRMGELCEVVVVVGIGGSYLGSRAVIEALAHPFHSLDRERKKPVMLFAGHHIGEDYHAALLDILDHYDYGLIVISKSGTTTEPAIAFRLLKDHIERKYGRDKARERIIAITDRSRGALKKLSSEQGYTPYVVPDDIGGRYSVLTPVGLLPIAVAGFNIHELLAGASHMEDIAGKSARMDENPAALYAAVRYALYRQGKAIEVLVNFLPALSYLAEWWKQLFGESEGKEHKGLFPASVNFTSDLHSLGQYIQDGVRHLFETMILVRQTSRHLVIPRVADDLDGLNYIAGKKLEEVNSKAAQGTLAAHVEGHVPVLTLEMERLDEFHLGQLLYFFEYACALSGYLLGVNPFDQPGVEAYKSKMFALLGKEGYGHS
ncbi:MAG: glucose-6-phosphate isomerase [Lentimicrobiaceae bacterium]|nr:glucose-6-phosphate isomerase [Lentimicrobiaceae bacterium]